MDLPTPREIELETLLRQRDAQVAELTVCDARGAVADRTLTTLLPCARTHQDEVSHLRQYLSAQPSPPTTEPISLPPALMTLLLPHITDHASNATPPANTVTTALIQRAKVLQEENDELYELLKSGETGRLKEDVRALRRVVEKLEGALRESHQVIASLSAELDKSHETIVMSGRQLNAVAPHARAHAHSPAPRHHQPPPHLSVANGSGKPPPTGPRAHKKPRLSETALSPAPSNTSLPIPPRLNLSQANSTPRSGSREWRTSVDRKPLPADMDVDEDQRSRPRSPEQDRERQRVRERQPERDRERERDRDKPRERVREREKERERERDRGRDRDRSARRNGAHGEVVGAGAGGRGVEQCCVLCERGSDVGGTDGLVMGLWVIPVRPRRCAVSAPRPSVDRSRPHLPNTLIARKGRTVPHLRPQSKVPLPDRRRVAGHRRCASRDDSERTPLATLVLTPGEMAGCVRSATLLGRVRGARYPRLGDVSG
ncbi:hypothetical protein A0H81_09941 [Grifola frondosa]|uniref:Uncharacterized protein n=1 Tax=Grifola frondosa TaxID=5627 RepID=A0A1C7M0K9_GRIFR|nr:hypothetical protein A0H81_09941 [Grifola frondosa]